jgi:hypothetical protein
MGCIAMIYLLMDSERGTAEHGLEFRNREGVVEKAEADRGAASLSG